jgi:hypothetical protein
MDNVDTSRQIGNLVGTHNRMVTGKVIFYVAQTKIILCFDFIDLGLVRSISLDHIEMRPAAGSITHLCTLYLLALTTTCGNTYTLIVVLLCHFSLLR